MDGTVHVVDFSSLPPAGLDDHCKMSSPVAESHLDAVWSVHWLPTPPDMGVRFQSSSSDGTISTWELHHGDFGRYQQAQSQPLMRLHKKETLSVSVPGGDTDISTLHPHPTLPSQQYILGTHTGHVVRYSTDDSSAHGTCVYLHAHAAPVYAIQYNQYHPTTFLTCSADWTVRIWDVHPRSIATTTHPLFQFDSGTGVGDAAWSPLVSTVFACVTDHGRVLVYDLAKDMNRPLCRQKVVEKAKLTKMAFDATGVVVLVGDDKYVIFLFDFV